MNQIAHLPLQTRKIGVAAALSDLGAAVRDIAGFIVATHVHAYDAPPAALRYPLSPRAVRFLRGSE